MLKHLGFGLNVLAIGVFFPGILLPMFNLKMSLAAILGQGSPLTSTLVDQELSIMQTIEELWTDQRVLVAVLILVFSVCIPLLKTGLVSISYFIKSRNIAAKILGFVNSIGKWSMADVFVVAVFLAVLSTNHADTATQKEVGIFGFKFVLELSSETLSNVGNGFYYFVGYCILSLLGSQLLHIALNKEITTHTGR